MEDAKVGNEFKFDAQAELTSISQKCRKGIYQHYKGGYYCLYSMSVHESLLVPLFHYYSLEKKIRWTRDYCAWSAVMNDGVPRFRFVREATPDEMAEACG